MSKRNLNAMKHGAFAKMIFLPGEDREEFEALHQFLIEDLDPQGPIQHDKVFNIAQNMWRKRRSGRYRNERSKYAEVIEHFEKNEIDTLIKFLEDAESGKPISEDDLKLPYPWGICYKKRFPRQKYDSDSAWLAAITERVIDLAERRVLERGEISKKVLDEFSDATVIAEELALEERLDAKIDKDIVALGRLKTMQGMGLMGRRTLEANEPPKDESLKKIDSPPIQTKRPIVGVDKEE